MKIDIIRHAQSCRNLIGQLPGLSMWQKIQYQKAELGDPLISNIGVKQCLELRQLLADKEYDTIFTSHMRRTIETAFLVFAPRDAVLEHFGDSLNADEVTERTGNIRMICPLPFIAETTGSPFKDTLTYSVSKQPSRADLQTWFSHPLFDYSHLPEKYTIYDYGKFISKLSSLHLDQTKQFALVCHGKVMKDIAVRNGIPKPKQVRNTELWNCVMNLETGAINVGNTVVPGRDFEVEATSGRRCKFTRGGRRTRTRHKTRRTRHKRRRV
jgi:broad specificity phosphatase PhoE